MKVRYLCGMVLPLFVAVALCGALPAGAQEIKLAFTPPITGASAAEGALQIKAIDLALKEINAAGGVNGKKINLVKVDNQSSNPGALAALQKAVEQEKALALIGFVKSTQVFAASDAIKTYGAPTFIGATNANLTKQGNPWLFRVRPDDSIAALAMVKYIKEDAKLTKVGILHDTDAFGTGGADLVEKYSKEQGLTVVKREKFTTKDKDYTAQLLSLKSAGIQVMVVYGTNPEDVADHPAPVPPAWLALQVSRLALQPDEGLPEPVQRGRRGPVGRRGLRAGAERGEQEYADDYKKEYSEDYDTLSAWTYDGLKILVDAIKKVGEDRTKIREAILATQGYKGVLGTFCFTPNGDGLTEVSVVQIEKGSPKLLKIVNVGAK